MLFLTLDSALALKEDLVSAMARDSSPDTQISPCSAKPRYLVGLNKVTARGTQPL